MKIQSKILATALISILSLNAFASDNNGKKELEALHGRLMFLDPAKAHQFDSKVKDGDTSIHPELLSMVKDLEMRGAGKKQLEALHGRLMSLDPAKAEQFASKVKAGDTSIHPELLLEVKKAEEEAKHKK